MQFLIAVLAASMTLHASAYQPGLCNVHITQVQVSDNSFGVTVTLTDSSGTVLGGNSQEPISAGQTLDTSSELPLIFSTTPGGPADPVSFAYGGVVWDTNAGQCLMGGYDASGSRQGDCQFTTLV